MVTATPEATTKSKMSFYILPSNLTITYAHRSKNLLTIYIYIGKICRRGSQSPK